MLTKKQQILRKRLLARIHVTHQCKHLKSIDAWEDFLMHRFEVTSCKDLSIDELNRVINELVKGETFTKNKPDFKGRAILKNDSITQKQITYMRGLWREKSKNKDEVSLLKFASKVIKKQYLHLHVMGQDEATRVISVLERRL